MTRLAPSPWPISSRMMASTTTPYSSSEVSKPPAVGEGELLARQRGEQLGERDLGLLLDVDDGQRGAVVVGVEAALGDLPERDRDQPVEPPVVVGHALLERYVEQALHLAAGAADEGDRARVAQPDHRPGLVPQHRLERGARWQGLAAWPGLWRPAERGDSGGLPGGPGSARSRRAPSSGRHPAGGVDGADRSGGQVARVTIRWVARV